MTAQRKILLAAGALVTGCVTFFGLSNAYPETETVVRADGELMSRFGMNVHRFAPADADRMRQLGIRYVRITMGWSGIETKRHIYDWSQLDGLVDMVASRGMRPVLILGYSNPLYAPLTTAKFRVRSKWQAPNTGEARTAYAAWAAAAARRYADKQPVWEIWNEPDTEGLWPDKPDPQAYSSLALQTCRAIRQAVGDAEIWGPGLSSLNNRSAVDSPFFHAVLATPLPECLSAISVHPYLFWSQIDSALSYWKALAKVPTTAQRPIVSSEVGLSNYNTRITPYTQASYLLRMMVYDHMAGVKASLWYDWKDDGDDPSDPEDHFGLLDTKGNSKPSMQALEQFASRMKGLNRQCLVQSLGMARLYAWNEGSPQNVTVLAWQTTRGFSTDPGGDVTINVPASSVDAADMLGTPATVTRDRDEWRISGGRMPYFVRYRGSLPPSCTS